MMTPSVYNHAMSLVAKTYFVNLGEAVHHTLANKPDVQVGDFIQYEERINNTTIATVVLTNGLVVVGKSQAFYSEDFNREVGEASALQNAMVEIFSIAAFDLQQKILNGEVTPEEPTDAPAQYPSDTDDHDLSVAPMTPRNMAIPIPLIVDDELPDFPISDSVSALTAPSRAEIENSRQELTQLYPTTTLTDHSESNSTHSNSSHHDSSHSTSSHSSSSDSGSSSSSDSSSSSSSSSFD